MVNTSVVLAMVAPCTCFGYTSNWLNDLEQTKIHKHYQMDSNRQKHKLGWRCRYIDTHKMNKWVGTGYGGILKAVKGDALGLQKSAH